MNLLKNLGYLIHMDASSFPFNSNKINVLPLNAYKLVHLSCSKTFLDKLNPFYSKDLFRRAYNLAYNSVRISQNSYMCILHDHSCLNNLHVRTFLYKILLILQLNNNLKSLDDEFDHQLIQLFQLGLLR